MVKCIDCYYLTEKGYCKKGKFYINHRPDEEVVCNTFKHKKGGG